MIQVSKNINILLGKEGSIGKTPPTKIDSFLITLFDLNQTRTIVLQKTVQFRTFLQCANFIFKLKV